MDIVELTERLYRELTPIAEQRPYRLLTDIQRAPYRTLAETFDRVFRDLLTDLEYQDGISIHEGCSYSVERVS